MNDWGHSGRDLGMRHANGEYFLQFNIDNKLFPHCLETISEHIDMYHSQVVIFAANHHKEHRFPFFGVPPRHCQIDAIQLVAHRDVWENVGYWYDKRDTSDGIIYEDIGNRFEYTQITETLAENY